MEHHQFAIFLSYAAEDASKAKSIASAHNHLKVFCYRPEQRIPRSLMQIFWLSVCQLLCLATRKADASGDWHVLLQRLNSTLDEAASVLVLWSRNHRSSIASHHEIEYFSREHPTRPVFYHVLDNSPLTLNLPYDALLNDTGALTIERIDAAASALDACAGRRAMSLPTLFRSICSPEAWIEEAARMRRGTSILELRKKPGLEVLGFKRIRARALALVIAAFLAVILLTALASIAVYEPTHEKAYVRNCVVLAGSMCFFSFLVSTQLSVFVTVLPLFASTVIGLVSVVAVSLLGNFSREAALPITIAVGVFLGLVLNYQYSASRHMVVPHDVGTAFALAIPRLVFSPALPAFLAALLVVALPADGRKIAPAWIVPLALVVGFIPALAVTWATTALVRSRERLYAGTWRWGFGIVAALAMVGFALSRLSPNTFDHTQPYVGVLDALIIALSLGASFLLPGARVGLLVPAYVTALAGSLSVVVVVAVLALILPVVRPDDPLAQEIRPAFLALIVASVISCGLAALVRLACRSHGRTRP